MDRYASGDTVAFRELHQQLAPRLRMFLLRLSGRARLADDLLQETFLRIHRARGTFSKGAAVVPWSYAIARNVFIDYARTRKGKGRSSASLDDLPDDNQPIAPRAAAPDAEVVAKEMLDIVRATLEKLPDTHREAFILIRFEGLSVAEAALVLDTSEANVKVRAFRAYEAFRQALKEGEKK
jgi:RNA polymerase sigma-70 factor (ECF subfamily)